MGAQATTGRTLVHRRILLLLRRPLVVALLVYALALAVRLPLLRMPIYGDEAVLYYLSKYPLQDPDNVYALDHSTTDRMSHFFWWRPLFRIMLTPGALVSFEGYRLLHLLMASALPPVSYLLLRRRQVRPWLAAATGAAIAVYPMLVHWGVIVFPDSTMVVAFVFGLLARAHGRHAWAAVAFVAAIWIKEVAVVGVGFVLAWDLINGFVAGSHTIRPLRLSPRVLLGAAAIALGLLPLWYYLRLGGIAPGWTPGGTGPELLDFFAPAPWLMLLPLIGLGWGRSRFYAALGLVYPIFYSVYAWILHRGVELWYMVEPMTLSILASSIVLEQLLRLRPRLHHRSARAAPVAAVALVFAVLAMQTFWPALLPPKSPVTTPIGGYAQAALFEVYERDYGPDPLSELMQRLEPADLETVFVVDIGWFFIAYPFSEAAQTVRYGYTGWEFTHRAELERWTRLVESDASVTIIYRSPTPNPLNEALRIAYGDCEDFQNQDYELVHGRRCPGRSERLIDEYERLTGRDLQ